MRNGSPSGHLTSTISRGFAGFLGGFSLLNLLGESASRDFVGNVWWIDLGPLPGQLARIILLLAAALLIAYAIRPIGSRWRRHCTTGAAGLLGLFAIANAATFFVLLARGEISSGFPVPLSLFIAAGLGLIAWGSRSPGSIALPVGRTSNGPAGEPKRSGAAIAVVCLSCTVAFPLGQMICFGHTDYRRRADAIVVFGARTYADGTPSQALADRVRTACQLYREGWADKLVFSGGPGDGTIDEPQAMRRFALNAGVPDSAIYCDVHGLNTDATVRNTDLIFRRLGVQRVLAVSHAYHLPRVKMTYQSRGWNVFTVPARETRTLSQTPFLMTREVVAEWAYYARCIGKLETRNSKSEINSN